MKRSLLLIALALNVIALTGCGPKLESAQRVKVSPSSEFLYALADEVEDDRAGPMCQLVIDDWIAQNMGVK